MSAISLKISPRERDLGGFSVRRILPFARRRQVGPFVFLDHMGPKTFAPGEGLDVRPHPHIGLATVTYLFEGQILHHDSLGVFQAIEPGAVNWMTAGRGIVHSERTDPQRRASGGRLHGIQAWVALPVEHEEVEPAFHHHGAATLPRFERDGVGLTLIAGSAFGHESPVTVFSRLFYLDAIMPAGRGIVLPAEYPERAVYVAEGELTVDGETVSAGECAVLMPDVLPRLDATADSRVMLLGGDALEPRIIWWNFVSSRHERIEQAKRDWREGRFDPVPGETDVIPLPAD